MTKLEDSSEVKDLADQAVQGFCDSVTAGSEKGHFVLVIHCLCLRIRTSDLPIQASEGYKMEHLYSELGSQALYASQKAATKDENQRAISST